MMRTTDVKVTSKLSKNNLNNDSQKFSSQNK